MRYAAISLMANTAGSILLFFVFRSINWPPELGIAIATSFGGWLNAWLLWSTLRKRGDFEIDRRFGRNIPFILLSSLTMAAVIYGMLYVLEPYLARSAGFVIQGGALSLLVIVGLMTYGIGILVTGVISKAQLSRFRRRAG